jgi:hypothetical protein
MDLRFKIPENGFDDDAMVDELLSDLRIDGFRPWRFAMVTWNEETEESDEVELIFHEDEEDDKYAHQGALQMKLLAAYADGSLDEASISWVKAEAFAAAKAGEEPEPMQGVIVTLSKATFEAVFIPDGGMLMEGAEAK